MPEKTCRVSLRPAKADAGQPGLGQDQFWTNVGAAFGVRAVIVTYVDGEPVGESPPVAVSWQLGGASLCLRSYRPTVHAGAPDYAVNQQANPLRLYYWLPEVPGAVSTVPITCDAQTQDGTWLQQSATLYVRSNPDSLVGGVRGQIQLQPLPNRNTLLSFGDSLGDGTPGLAVQRRVDVARYPGWLGVIQLVKSVRSFTGESGRVYSLVDTGNSYVLDAASTDPDFIYGKSEIEDGEIDGSYTFDDTPNQELLPVIGGDPITSFTVDESYRATFVFNGSTSLDPSGDTAQIWFPVAPTLDWGWRATVTNDGANHWTIGQSSVAGPTPTTMVPPSWQGTIRSTGESDPLRAIQRRERIG